MGIGYLLIGTLIGTIAAITSLSLGHSAGQVLMNYVMMGNLTVMSALALFLGLPPVGDTET